MNPLLSFNFYKEVVEHKILSDIIGIFWRMDSVQPAHIYLVKVLSVFMHPIYGDIFTFPWLRSITDCKYSRDFPLTHLP